MHVKTCMSVVTISLVWLESSKMQISPSVDSRNILMQIAISLYLYVIKYNGQVCFPKSTDIVSIICLHFCKLRAA